MPLELVAEIAGEVAESAESFAAELSDAANILESANETLGEVDVPEINIENEMLNQCSLLDTANDSLGQEENENVGKGEVESAEKQGGRFGDIYKEGEGETTEVHHMPADSTTELSRNDGPAIKMDKADHRQTASCGNSLEAREYRAEQKKLIDQGKFREAVQMDIDDIHDKFGDKYDEAINQMLDYVDELEKEGKI